MVEEKIWVYIDVYIQYKQFYVCGMFGFGRSVVKLLLPLLLAAAAEVDERCHQAGGR